MRTGRKLPDVAIRVEFHPLAAADVSSLYNYLEGRGGCSVASTYIDKIESLCASLADLSERGKPRDDLAPGVRTITMERRVLIAYRASAESVLILRVLYAGQHFGADDLPP